jgi:hypothetical protein
MKWRRALARHVPTPQGGVGATRNGEFRHEESETGYVVA